MSDLRLRFGLPKAEHTDQTCIIVIDGHQPIGIIVDTVSEVLDIAAEDVELSPDLGGGSRHSFLRGMAKVNGKIKILLDIDAVLSCDALARITAAV